MKKPLKLSNNNVIVPLSQYRKDISSKEVLKETSLENEKNRLEDKPDYPQAKYDPPQSGKIVFF